MTRCKQSATHVTFVPPCAEKSTSGTDTPSTGTGTLHIIKPSRGAVSTEVHYVDVEVYLGVPSLAISCASSLQIRYTGHNSARRPQDEELDKIQNTGGTNAKCQLDKYKMPTTGSLIDSARRLHTSLQRHPSSHTGGEILEI